MPCLKHKSPPGLPSLVLASLRCSCSPVVCLPRLVLRLLVGVLGLAGDLVVDSVQVPLALVVCQWQQGLCHMGGGGIAPEAFVF